MKVVICDQHGGFGLSAAGITAYLARQGKTAHFFTNARKADGHIDFDRTVPAPNPDKEFVFFTYTSPEATKDDYFSARDIPRNDPDLVAVVEELGQRAAGKHCTLKIVTIPDDVEFQIEEYDGLEWVAEKHRTWS